MDATLVVTAAAGVYLLSGWLIAAAGGDAFVLEALVLVGAWTAVGVGGGGWAWAAAAVASGALAVVAYGAGTLGERGARRLLVLNLAAVTLLPRAVPAPRLPVIGGAVALALVLGLAVVVLGLLHRTAHGRLVRACGAGPEFVSRLGLRPRRVQGAAFFVAGALAGAGAAMHVAVGPVAGWGLGMWCLLALGRLAAPYAEGSDA